MCTSTIILLLACNRIHALFIIPYHVTMNHNTMWGGGEDKKEKEKEELERERKIWTETERRKGKRGGGGEYAMHLTEHTKAHPLQPQRRIESLYNEAIPFNLPFTKLRHASRLFACCPSSNEKQSTFQKRKEGHATPPPLPPKKKLIHTPKKQSL